MGKISSQKPREIKEKASKGKSGGTKKTNFWSALVVNFFWLLLKAVRGKAYSADYHSETL